MGAGELFSTYGADLLRRAKRITGSDADAEEAVAETFLGLVRNPRLLAPDRDPLPYLRRAVLNRALNQLRRRRRAPDPLPPMVPAREIESHELAERLRDGIRRLTPRQAEVFILRHLEGSETDEIAAALELSSATVRVHLHHATKTLRRLFDSEEVRNV